MSCPQMHETRSDALDSSIPAFTRPHWYYLPILGVPSAKAEGVPRGGVLVWPKGDGG